MIEELGDKVRDLLGAPRRRREARDAAWRRVAERRDATYVEAGGSIWRWEPPKIETIVGDASVELSLHAQQAGNTRVVLTRARADYVLGIGPRMKVYRSGWSGSFGTMLGFEDVELGDPSFDDAFVVRTADVEATRRAFTPRARAVSHSVRDFDPVLQTTHDRVTVMVPRILEEEEHLDAMIDLAGDLAGYGREWLDAMRAVPEAEWRPPEGPWDDRSSPSARVIVRGHPVHLHPVVLGSGVVARATSPTRRELSPFELAIDAAGRPDVDPPDGLLGPTSAPLLAEIGEGTVSSDGQAIRVTIPIESSTGRLHHAVELAGALALGDQRAGTFR